MSKIGSVGVPELGKSGYRDLNAVLIPLAFKVKCGRKVINIHEEAHLFGKYNIFELIVMYFPRV